MARATKLTRAHKQLLSREGFRDIPLWQLLDELSNTIIIKHRLTGEIRVVDK